MVDMDPFFPAQRDSIWGDVFPLARAVDIDAQVVVSLVITLFELRDIEFTFLVPPASTAEIPRSHCYW